MKCLSFFSRCCGPTTNEEVMPVISTPVGVGHSTYQSTDSTPREEETTSQKPLTPPGSPLKSPRRESVTPTKVQHLFRRGSESASTVVSDYGGSEGYPSPMKLS